MADVDVIAVGSGFGGSVVACRLAAMPGAVGANPSLTIAAFAERCSARIEARLDAPVRAGAGR